MNQYPSFNSNNNLGQNGRSGTVSFNVTVGRLAGSVFGAGGALLTGPSGLVAGGGGGGVAARGGSGGGSRVVVPPRPSGGGSSSSSSPTYKYPWQAPGYKPPAPAPTPPPQLGPRVQVPDPSGSVVVGGVPVLGQTVFGGPPIGTPIIGGHPVVGVPGAVVGVPGAVVGVPGAVVGGVGIVGVPSAPAYISYGNGPFGPFFG